MPQATPVELQAILNELGIPQGDPASMALLQSLVQNSGLNVAELFASLLPELDEADEIRSPGKMSGRKSKSSKSRASGRRADDLDEIVEEALSQRSPEKTRQMLEKAVKNGEEQLAEAFQDHVGHFWLLSETRPYMRARLQLVHFLLAQGEHETAISHMQEMLRLNPDDNQGVRWLLLEWYCNMNWLDKAMQLLDEYPAEDTPFMILTRVCLDFQLTGPSEVLETMLQDQLESNPHIAPKLLDQEEVSPFAVKSFIVGDEDEADAYCQSFRSLWKATPGALPWLSSVFRDLTPAELELTRKEIAEMAEEGLEAARSLPSKKEVWFCDIDVLDEDGHSLEFEIDWDEEESPTNWLMSLINDATSEAVHIEPGEFPMNVDSILCELCRGMSNPNTGRPRRPKTIRIHDAALCQRLTEPLKRIGINVEVAEEIPELIQFLRSQRFDAEATPFPLDDILEVPENEREIWEIDWRTVETWIPDPETNEPVQPWMVLVGAPESGMIRSQQLSMTPPTENMIARVLAEAILNPMQGDVARPTVLIVRQLSHRLELESRAKSIGCDVVVGDCQLVDHVHQSLQENNIGNAPKFGALIHQPDMTPEIIGDFFRASAAYYKSRIYTRVRAELTVEISCPELLPVTFTAVTMGQMGQEIGIMLFDNPKTVLSMFRSNETDSEKNARKISGIGYSTDRRDLLHPADVAAAEQFGWPVPSSETWPSVYYIEKGTPRGLNAAELRFVSVAIQTTLEMLTGTRNSAQLDIPLHDRTVRVNAKKVSVV